MKRLIVKKIIVGQMRFLAHAMRRGELEYLKSEWKSSRKQDKRETKRKKKCVQYYMNRGKRQNGSHTHAAKNQIR